MHFILSFSHEEYGRATSISHLSEQLTGSKGHPPYQDGVSEDRYVTPTPPLQTRRANATFVLLARNSDLNGVMVSMKQIGESFSGHLCSFTNVSSEDRFNKEFQYPYVFLNEEPFSEEFKEYVIPSITSSASSRVAVAAL